MAVRRFSRLQKHLLAWLAVDERRTGGVLSRSHQDLVVALQGDKGNISHRLRTLEARGPVVIGRSRGEKAASLSLTSEGQKSLCPRSSCTVRISDPSSSRCVAKLWRKVWQLPRLAIPT